MNVIDILKKADIFSGLNKNELEQLACLCKEKVFEELKQKLS